MRNPDPTAGAIRPAHPEEFLPRLGDYLLERQFISSSDLKDALDYQLAAAAPGPDAQPGADQSANKPSGKKVLLGQALVQMGRIEQHVLDQAIASQLADYHAALQTANEELERRIHLRTRDLEHRLNQIRASAEITQLIVTATDVSELLRQVTDLIAERFGFHLVAVYLVTDEQRALTLAEASGPFAPILRQQRPQPAVDGRSIVGWCALNNRTRIAPDVQSEFSPSPGNAVTGKVVAEAVVPIALRGAYDEPSAGADLAPCRVQGVLDVQFHSPLAPAGEANPPLPGGLQSGGTLDADTVAVLETIANHTAEAMENIRLMDASRHSLAETQILYHASQRLNRSAQALEIYQSLAEALKEIDYPTQIRTAFVLPEQTALSGPAGDGIAARPMLIPTSHFILYGRGEPALPLAEEAELTISLVETYLPPETPYLLLDASHPGTYPAALAALPAHLNCRTAALIAVRLQRRLHALVIVGLVPSSPASIYPLAGKLSYHTQTQDPANASRMESMVQMCVSICNLASNALERISASIENEKREAALVALNRISQFVTMQMDLHDFYQAIHAEVNRIIGEVNFLIAIYNPETRYIGIPYLYEPADGDVQIQQIDPFPLGAGLTSILINTRKPLMIVEDMERRAVELGALTVGLPSKSWLGVPLMVAGDVIGAMILQDADREHRFDEDDLQLMTTLGSQVAVAIRTAQLLQSTRVQAERQRQINEITSRIRSSNNRQTIIETAAQEMRNVLGAARITIEVGIPTGQAKALQPQADQPVGPE